ncbi:ABC transporter ATP-binding protein [uncultured Roseobacter sp.]|uniref:ABC transporter ATP-binding protein n=1 Tax=uncultured Roseobacter sp. TaxID=114847 RepID=UPI0026072721|nr:ABC transporter ATP-binding protein [uncultured Roseobacter sp.]
MSVSHRYKNFGGSRNKEPEKAADSQEKVEEEKLASFEAGYQAGWDDSAKAQSDAKDKISSDFAQNLQEMSFSYHEALSKLTLSLKPVMKEIVDRLLPEIMARSLAGHILEQVDALLKSGMSQPVEIVVAPQNVELVESIGAGNIKEPFSVTGDASAGEGQAFVRMGSEEREVDIDGVLAGVSQAVDAFFHEAQKEQPDE